MITESKLRFLLLTHSPFWRVEKSSSFSLSLSCCILRTLSSILASSTALKETNVKPSNKKFNNINKIKLFQRNLSNFLSLWTQPKQSTTISKSNGHFYNLSKFPFCLAGFVLSSLNVLYAKRRFRSSSRKSFYESY